MIKAWIKCVSGSKHCTNVQERQRRRACEEWYGMLPTEL